MCYVATLFIWLKATKDSNIHLLLYFAMKFDLDIQYFLLITRRKKARKEIIPEDDSKKFLLVEGSIEVPCELNKGWCSEHLGLQQQICYFEEKNDM